METEPGTLPIQDDGEGSESLRSGFNPLLAVVAAILVALAVVSVGYFGFKRPPRDYHGATTESTSSSTTQTESTTITSSDIQKAVDMIDSSFNQLDDNKDFNPADLSDSSLGL